MCVYQWDTVPLSFMAGRRQIALLRLFIVLRRGRDDKVPIYLRISNDNSGKTTDVRLEVGRGGRGASTIYQFSMEEKFAGESQIHPKTKITLGRERFQSIITHVVFCPSGIEP